MISSIIEYLQLNLQKTRIVSRLVSKKADLEGLPLIVKPNYVCHIIYTLYRNEINAITFPCCTGMCGQLIVDSEKSITHIHTIFSIEILCVE